MSCLSRLKDGLSIHLLQGWGETQAETQHEDERKECYFIMLSTMPQAVGVDSQLIKTSNCFTLRATKLNIFS